MSTWSKNNPFQIQTDTGQTFTVLINPDETVAEVKRKVRDKVGIPPDQQRLIFHGTEIQEQTMAPQRTIQEILQEQDLIMEEQDKAIDELAGAVSRIKQISLAMNTEITTQNKMLDDLTKDVDETNEHVARANKKVNKLHKQLKKNMCNIM